MSELSKSFRDMAERIDKGDDAEFAGAVVIVPPADQGEPIAFLLTDPAPDGLTFWTNAVTRAEIGRGKFNETAEAADLRRGRR